ncbi:MAG: ABC transporter ATP-binding protein [Bradyrhizobium sp.]
MAAVMNVERDDVAVRQASVIDTVGRNPYDNARQANRTLLSTRALERHFGGLKAVDGVDFSLDHGEIRAIIGPNGAGKTTFVSLLCGRVSPTSGTIVFEGADVTRLPAYRRVRRGIAYTFQITNVFANLSVFDNVMLAAQSHIRRSSGFFARLNQAELDRKAMAALSAVGLGTRGSVKAGELAYGHQRLLEVAMGLALEPLLLILDEPTQGLSDSEIDEFCTLIKRIAASTTILLIEHNMQVVMQLADKITVMNRGKILAEGNPAEIRDNPEVQAAYLAA